MDILIAGLASGALMAHTFVTIWCISMFFIIKNPPPSLAAAIERLPPGGFLVGVMAAAFPIWGIIGVVLAFLFVAMENGAPGAGLGASNIAYTAGVSAASIMLALPFGIAIRRLLPGVASIALASAGIFGWLLPFLAS